MAKCYHEQTLLIILKVYEVNFKVKFLEIASNPCVIVMISTAAVVRYMCKKSVINKGIQTGFQNGLKVYQINQNSG